MAHNFAAGCEILFVTHTICHKQSRCIAAVPGYRSCLRGSSAFATGTQAFSFLLVCFTVPCSPILISWYPLSSDTAFISHLEQVFSGECLPQMHALQIVFLQLLRQNNDKMYFSQSFPRCSEENATGLSLCSTVGVNLNGFKIQTQHHRDYTSSQRTSV